LTIARCLMRLLKSADGGLARGFRVPMGKGARRLRSHERHYTRLSDEQRMRDESMRMEARMANAHDELLPAMRTAVERVDDKVDKVAATVSAMAEELAWLREHVQSVVPSGSAASTVALPLASEQVSQQVPHMRQPTKDASPPQDFIASCGAADAATHSNIAVGFQMAPEAPPDPERMRQLRRNLAGPDGRPDPKRLKDFMSTLHADDPWRKQIEDSLFADGIVPAALIRKRRLQTRSREEHRVDEACDNRAGPLSSSSSQRSFVSAMSGAAASAITSMAAVVDPRVSVHVTDAFEPESDLELQI